MRDLRSRGLRGLLTILLLSVLPAIPGAGAVAQEAAAEPAGPVCADAVRDRSDPERCLPASRTPRLGALFPLSEDFFVDALTGHVGIGTTTPGSALEVATDEPGGDAIVGEGGRLDFGFAGGAGVTGQGGVGPFGGTGVSGTGGAANQSDGGTGVFGQGGSGFDGFGGAGVRGEAGTGGLGTGWGVFAVGPLGATGAKSFVQPHPEDPSLEIRFVSLEGNESGTYFRGTGSVVGGRAVIEVPEEFRAVTSPAGLTVQLTPVGSLATLAVESQDLHSIHVLGSEDVRFHYFVNGVRRGFEDVATVAPNRTFVPGLRGVPYGSNLGGEIRRLLVANGILNEDYTPNEETAARMGWTLVDGD